MYARKRQAKKIVNLTGGFLWIFSVFFEIVWGNNKPWYIGITSAVILGVISLELGTWKGPQ